MKHNILVERFQRKLGCGAVVTRFRETVLDAEEEESLKKGEYFKDRLWEEEN